MNFASRLLLASLLLFNTTQFAYSTVDSTAAKAAFQFLDEPVSPRQIAMGGAAAAMPGVGFSQYNPAQPFFSGDPSLSIGYMPIPGDAKGVYAEGFWSRSDMFFGMHLSNFLIHDIIPSTAQGMNENTPFSSGFSLVSLAVGMKRERFSLAIDVSGMQDRIGTATAFGVSVSAGAACRLIPGRLDLGLALLNEGTATGYTDETQKWGQGDRMPRSARLGAAFTDTIRSVPFAAALDIVYRDVGDKVQQIKGVAPRITVPAGVELWPTPYVALRVGKRFNFETEIINFGGGFRFRPLSFDMSFVVAKLYRDIEVRPAFGLMYSPVPKHAAKTAIIAPAVEVKPIQGAQPSQQEEAPIEQKNESPQPPVSKTAEPQSLPSSQSQPQQEPSPSPAQAQPPVEQQLAPTSQEPPSKVETKP